jgi:hypothetical protein
MMINTMGLGTMFLTMAESVVSLYLLDSLGRKKLRVLLDRASFITISSGCIGMNVAWVCAARP